MNSPLVTIALSAYNVAEFVDAALDCLENQSYTNIEILCIDDCSTDGTYEKLLCRAGKGTRYRVLRQPKNMGLSVSRNRAIDEANGEYILMLDGDDLFHKDLVKLAVTAAVENDVDMVMWDYIPFREIGEQERLKQLPSSLVALDVTNKLALLKRPAFMWTRLLKVDTLRKLGVHFTEGLTKQDIPIHWQLITSLNKIALVSQKLSYYRIQPNATSCRKGKSVFSLAKVMDITEKYLKDSNHYLTYRDEFLRSRLELLSGMYDFIKAEYKAEALSMVKARLNLDALSYLENGAPGLTRRTRLFYEMLRGSIISKIQYKTIMAARTIYRALR